jgi:hypothetical protein
MKVGNLIGAFLNLVYWITPANYGPTPVPSSKALANGSDLPFYSSEPLVDCVALEQCVGNVVAQWNTVH